MERRAGYPRRRRPEKRGQPTKACVDEAIRFRSSPPSGSSTRFAGRCRTRATACSQAIRVPEFSAGLLDAYLRKSELDPNLDVSAALFAAVERSTARSLIATLGQDIADRLGGVSDVNRSTERKLFIARDAAMRRFNRLRYDPQSNKMTPEQVAAWEAFQKASEELSAFSQRIHKQGIGSSGSPVAPCTPAQAAELLYPNEVAVSFVLGSRESFAVVVAPENGRNLPSVILRRFFTRGERAGRTSLGIGRAGRA